MAEQIDTGKEVGVKLLVKTRCVGRVFDCAGEVPPCPEGGFFDIKSARLVVTDQCPYSCVYCGVYYQKALEQGLITEEEFRRRDIGGNEGSSIGSWRINKDRYLDAGDYEFLAAVLIRYFNMEDVTFSGGDPFVRTDLREIIDRVSALGVRTTALTKGLPLFSESGEEFVAGKAGRLSRVIFSLDTLDSGRHASVNLPLAEPEVAVTALSKTLAALGSACRAGYEVDINAVVAPVDFAAREETDASFWNTRRIIEHALDAGVRKVKFIELDQKGTMGRPYIEEYFNEMGRRGYLGGLDLHCAMDQRIDLEHQSHDLGRIQRSGGDMRLCLYRTHCPETLLGWRNGSRNKKCEFAEGGELNLNSIGQVVACQRRAERSHIDMRKHIKDRNIAGVIGALNQARDVIVGQGCPICDEEGGR